MSLLLDNQRDEPFQYQNDENVEILQNTQAEVPFPELALMLPK